MEVQVKEVTEELFLIEVNPPIECFIDNSEGKEIRVILGLLAEIVDLRDLDDKWDDEEYPIIILTSLIPLEPINPEVLKKALECCGLEDCELNRELVAYALNTYVGGVPVNMEIIKSSMKEKKEGEIETVVEADCQGRVHRRFKTREDAERWIREVIAPHAEALRFVGFFLDEPINLLGNTGWDIVELCVLNKEMIEAVVP